MNLKKNCISVSLLKRDWITLNFIPLTGFYPWFTKSSLSCLCFCLFLLYNKLKQIVFVQTNDLINTGSGFTISLRQWLIDSLFSLFFFTFSLLIIDWRHCVTDFVYRWVSLTALLECSTVHIVRPPPSITTECLSSRSVISYKDWKTVYSYDLQWLFYFLTLLRYTQF